MHWLTAGMLSVWTLVAGAQGTKSGPSAVGATVPTPILVELFTSEGCSSCPPADELLGRISGKVLPSGRAILTISEHVTYWNHDGWEDPFSSEEATERQQSYVDRLRVEKGPYTPQMVVNGSAQVAGSDATAVADALKRADEASAGVGVSMGEVRVEKGVAEIHFELTGEDRKPRKLEVTAFVTDDSDQVQVKRGENADRVLTHVTVARALKRVDLPKEAATGVVRVKLPAKPPMGAASGRHLLVVVQEEGDGPVLAAASRAL